MASLYSRDNILVLFQCIIKQDYQENYLLTVDWSQSMQRAACSYAKSDRDLRCPGENRDTTKYKDEHKRL